MNESLSFTDVRWDTIKIKVVILNELYMLFGEFFEFYFLFYGQKEMNNFA